LAAVFLGAAAFVLRAPGLDFGFLAGAGAGVASGVSSGAEPGFTSATGDEVRLSLRRWGRVRGRPPSTSE
jgi:hypothetical protein